MTDCPFTDLVHAAQSLTTTDHMYFRVCFHPSDGTVVLSENVSKSTGEPTASVVLTIQWSLQESNITKHKKAYISLC